MAEKKAKPLKIDILWDAHQRASEMVWVPSFNWNQRNGFKARAPHPAFVIGGERLVNGFWIGTNLCWIGSPGGSAPFMAELHDSYHGFIGLCNRKLEPRGNVTFDAARKACANKNGKGVAGWHLSTVREWHALSLLKTVEAPLLSPFDEWVDGEKVLESRVFRAITNDFQAREADWLPAETEYDMDPGEWMMMRDHQTGKLFPSTPRDYYHEAMGFRLAKIDF